MATSLEVHKHGLQLTKRKRRKKSISNNNNNNASNPKKKHISDLKAPQVTLHKNGVEWKPASDQAEWLTETFHTCHGSFLSPLERDPIPGDRLIQLLEEKDRSSLSLSWHVKHMFGAAWRPMLCEAQSGSNREKGSPTLLILCSSASRCVELLKALRHLTKECKAAKLFAKHIKVEEQVSALEGFINIAAGTPNRVKKLLDLGALALGRLSVLLLDMHQDAKGLTLFTLPQVKTEFWELYREHFHQRLLDKQMQLCLY